MPSVDPVYPGTLFFFFVPESYLSLRRTPESRTIIEGRGTCLAVEFPLGTSALEPHAMKAATRRTPERSNRKTRACHF